MNLESFEENHQRNPDWLSDQLDALQKFARSIDPKADLDQLAKDLEKLHFRISSAVAQANAQTAQLHHEVQEIERAIDIKIRDDFDGPETT